MIFNVNLGISGLVNKDASDQKGRDVALFIGDTVAVSPSSGATVLTTRYSTRVEFLLCM